MASPTPQPPNLTLTGTEVPTWQLLKALKYCLPAPIVGPHHKHDHYFQLFQVIEGEEKVTIGNESFDVNGITTFWIPPGVWHSSIEKQDSCPRILEIKFRANNPPNVTLNPLAIPFCLPTNANYPLFSILSDISLEFAIRKPYWEWVVSSMIDHIIALSHRLTSEPLLATKQRYCGYIIDSNAIEKSVQFIQEHFANQICLEDLAGASDMSINRFSKTFLVLNGTTPAKYLMKFRLDRAIDMMEEDRWTLTQIATAVGFNSLHHFSNTFKKFFGTSPSCYFGSANN